MTKIVVTLDQMMAKRKVKLNELAAKIDLTEANLSILKTGKAKAIRFSTLEALCEALDCQPGDLLEFDTMNSIKNMLIIIGICISACWYAHTPVHATLLEKAAIEHRELTIITKDYDHE